MVKLDPPRLDEYTHRCSTSRYLLSPQVRTALTLEAKEDARRFFDQERVKLLQEIAELKSSKKQTDEALSNMIQADKMKAGDLRVEHQQHQEQISKIKWDCERDIRRLVRPACPLEGLVLARLPLLLLVDVEQQQLRFPCRS